MSMNSLYQLYLQQTNRQPLSQLSANNQQAAAAQSGDTNFQDLWNYLKWARKAYDLYARVSGNPTTGNYINQAWDYGKNWLSDTPSAAPEAGTMGAELGAEYAAGEGGADVAGLAGAGAGTAGAEAGSGLAGLSAGGYATVAAPLIMAYMKYQAGSGRNEPVEKMQDTRKTGRLLSDILKEKDIDWSNTENQYGLKPKYLSSDVSGESIDNYNQMVDPRGWTPKELYDRMLEESSQYYQTGGVGNSGYTGNQINESFGSDQGKLAAAMGLPSLPDWAYHDKGSGFSPDYLSNNPTGQALQAQVGKNPYDDQWNALSEQDRSNYSSLQSPEMYEGYGRSIWEKDQLIKELNDRYKMGLKPYAERMAARNQGW